MVSGKNFQVEDWIEKSNENHEDEIRKQFNNNYEILNKKWMVWLIFVIASLEELWLNYKLPKTP